MKDQLLCLVPTYEILATSSKIHLIQSVVSRLLVEHIFQAYFVGLSKSHSEELERVEKYLTSFGKPHSSTPLLLSKLIDVNRLNRKHEPMALHNPRHHPQRSIPKNTSRNNSHCRSTCEANKHNHRFYQRYSTFRDQGPITTSSGQQFHRALQTFKSAKGGL